MKLSFVSIALSVAGLLLSANLALAADAPAGGPVPVATKASATVKSAKPKLTTKTKAAPTVKLVDINSASPAALKKLPGVGDAEAAKIVAGRPYGSKAWLVSHNLLTVEQYGAVKDLVIAKLTKKDVAKITAVPGKKQPQ